MQRSRVTLLEQALLAQLASLEARTKELRAQIAETKARTEEIETARRRATLARINKLKQAREREMTPEQLKHKFYTDLEKLEELLDKVIVSGIKSKEIENIGDFSHMLANMCEGSYESYQGSTGD
jgi:hypothetical protein